MRHRGSKRILATGLALVIAAVNSQFPILAGEMTATNAEPEAISGQEVSKTTLDRKAPPLVITELLPDSANKNGADAYEFIEIYNNSDKDINLKDYKLYYNYPDTGVDTIWWETSEDKILKSGETLVFWIKNAGNTELTIEDFNKKFDVSLTEEQLIQISTAGMANSGRRGIKIATNVKDIVDYVIYNDGVKDTSADKSITYQSQYQDGQFVSVKTNNQAVTTPGSVSEEEKPQYMCTLTIPEKEPVLVDKTPTAFFNDSESLGFMLEAVSSESTVKTVTLYWKYNQQENFETCQLLRENGDIFVKTLGNVDLLNKKSFTYYFEVSDGVHEIKTQEKTIINQDNGVQVQLNVGEKETLAGIRQLIAYGNTLTIDGKDVSAESIKSVNGVGKIAFDATDTDVFFKNAVAVGNDVIGIFNEGTYSDVRTYVYDINAEKFDAQTKTITAEFHAGNKANVLEHNIENNDDFVIKNIRLVLPNGDTLYPVRYEAKKGLGAVEHENMDVVEKEIYSVASQDTEIKMGDTAGKPEILYVTFQLEEGDFEAIRYEWDTKAETDGEHIISNGTEMIPVIVDNTAPEISIKIDEQEIEDGKLYHNGTIQIESNDAISTEVNTKIYLDEKEITVPYEFSSLKMTAGTHKLKVVSTDEVGNAAQKEAAFYIPQEDARIDVNNTININGNPVFSIEVQDESNDNMTVSLKKGEHYTLGDENITVDKGISNQSGSVEKIFEENNVNGFPYEKFTIDVGTEIPSDAMIDIKWTGSENNSKTFLYAYNTRTQKWDKLQAEQKEENEQMTLKALVSVENYLLDGKIQVIVQNGEGYTPTQYDASNLTASREITTSNVDDTSREDYDFTFAIESDTQYYNEDYEGNPDQSVDGVYQYQLDIHNWLLLNRERMNIQYLFHDGDIIDDEPNEKEWEQADVAYDLLDKAGMPYGILAGNHDVGHLSGDYHNYSKYFGQNRYNQNAWYGESYKDNRGHYDLISVGGIDFLMIYMGWGIGDEEIAWMNEVLAKYPERKAILNFHEYLLASGGLGEEPQRVHDEVIAVNENVCMVLSGHYHNAKTTIDTFINADGTERKVYNMLFDYQGLPEGGLGYMRLLHFDLDGERMIVRTYSPSLDDYDAKTSQNQNEGNDYVVPGADDGINDAENFEVSFADLGIVSYTKTISTTSLDINVYTSEMIGCVNNVSNGTVTFEWKNAEAGVHGWYAEVTDENGGVARTDVNYIEVEKREETTEEETTPEQTETEEETTPEQTETEEETTPEQTETEEETTLKQTETEEETTLKQTETEETTDKHTSKEEQTISQQESVYESEQARMDKTAFAELLKKNKEQAVRITSNDCITFYFAKGSMKEGMDMAVYDFGSKIVKEYTSLNNNVKKNVKEDNLVCMVSYNYSGEFPAEAEISISVGKEYAGKTLYYYLCKEDESLELIQEAKVNDDGVMTVKQTHCSDYVILNSKITNGFKLPTTKDTAGMTPLVLLALAAGALCVTVRKRHFN